MAAAKKPGPGQKVCAKCGELNGTRSAKCKKCGAAFEIKGSAGKRGGFGVVRLVAEYVKECGSFEDARAELDSFDTLIKQTGGIAAARAAIDELENIKKMK